MLQFRGRSALSSFRLEKLLHSIQAIVPQISNIDTEYCYFCETRRDLTREESDRLRQLLDAVQTPPAVEQGGQLLLVVPRPGTISPWSSKATDIAHHCGLDMVERLERGIIFQVQHESTLLPEQLRKLEACIHDRMTEAVLYSLSEAAILFRHLQPAALLQIAVMSEGMAALQRANQAMGLALSTDEIEYLFDYFTRVQRDPTDVELMMFAQANSEHCRHKIFNADWIIDGEPQARSLFDMIRHTHQMHPEHTIVAYADNAAILEGETIERFYPGPGGQYDYASEPTHWLIKVETHNHPTAISPYPGAATGVGGEIRDEGATGAGAKPKAGLTGFCVSNLRIPGAIQPWETGWADDAAGYGKPGYIAAALDIMLTGPIGGAAFNNEFGRPNLAGFFRTYEMKVDSQVRGYHKPIMLAGGIGQISALHTEKQPFKAGALLVHLGGPGMAIGLGGGAASSMDAGANDELLDFNSVQRGNAEMQRRAQEVIDRCWQLARSGQPNPILAIHDVGAGGLSNALPELVHGAECGGQFDLRAIPSDEPGMSPLQIWCNEAQERYVLAIRPESLPLFQAICARERCPFAVVGQALAQPQLTVTDAQSAVVPVDMLLSTLLGKPPRMLRDIKRCNPRHASLELAGVTLQQAAYRVLRLPAVANKTFLIAIGDRSVGGLTARDQMVGPWQVPVADVAVTAMGFQTYLGEAFAMGERAPLALIHAAASARMAVGEAITNMAAAAVGDLGEVRLSANWMAAAGHPGEDAALYDAVQAVAMALCPQLGISIPVGKDSLSMKTAWTDADGKHKEVIAPLSLIISAFAKVRDIRRTLTPQLCTDSGETRLILIDLGGARHRLGGSALAQVYGQLGNQAPDLENPEMLKAFFAAIQSLNRQGLLLAYHDRSDGGLFAALCEMAFAGHCGITVALDQLCCSPASAVPDAYSSLPAQMLAVLFSEELGAVIQVKAQQQDAVMDILAKAGLGHASYVLGALNQRDEICFMHNHQPVFQEKRVALQRAWSETTFEMQRLRDHPQCAQQEYDQILDAADPGLHVLLTFDPNEVIGAPYVHASRPAVAILREQGVNGHVEMAAAFDRAGFRAVDVHMSDILSGRAALADYKGLVACGGFSYGDVLGAGRGWAQSILFNTRARDQFAAFFARPDTFALGVCNGCQMMSHLREIIPGSAHWPVFGRNQSEQFEARFVMAQIGASPSLFFEGMAGSRLPITVSHGEGRAIFQGHAQMQAAEPYIALRFVDHQGTPTENYPLNPNGSHSGITGVTSTDGRVTIVMPHPERVFRSVQHSWHPNDWSEDAPWMRMFRNARKWVD
ncbi:phosphoribosylformylglycinamidine synthase [Nitrosomonas halophila]|uniref:Phosphoribosylformylglycinamidine synthase n=1 Tax=Nitrosomonas halophila TaxID=44576 RepID=A0A1H3GXR5_9PROT|nr:phosphoribosylformylglycinamidine synthase [Nitrosomonas halophila]SDY08082.1 phosphoribosylformylglycinamidine synthase [Nitrosomonas halophila]